MSMMGGWTKSPPELVARFDAAIARRPGAERRLMFGFPAAFFGGNLATCLYQDTWAVRLPATDRAELVAMPEARPFEPARGRAMKEYVVLPPEVVADDATLDAWLGRAAAYAASLPAREKAPRKAAR
jgi:TfoX/Sxy family transcriptional regulator of competence genes